MIDKLVFLRGRRVNLRPVLRSDIPNLVRWVNNPDVRNYIAAHLPAMEKNEEDWLEKLAKDPSSDFVLVIETKDGHAIGVMGVHRINWRDRICTTGANIGEKEYWGKGLGTEAKMLLLDHLFNSLNLHKVCSQVIVYNKRSYNYSRRCGYKEEGKLRKHAFRKGRYWDVINLAVFREDFLKAKRKFSELKG